MLERTGDMVAAKGLKPGDRISVFAEPPSLEDPLTIVLRVEINTPEADAATALFVSKYGRGSASQPAAAQAKAGRSGDGGLIGLKRPRGSSPGLAGSSEDASGPLDPSHPRQRGRTSEGTGNARLRTGSERTNGNSDDAGPSGSGQTGGGQPVLKPATVREGSNITKALTQYDVSSGE